MCAKKWIVAALAVMALLLAACNTSGCLENRNSLPLAGFYSAATDRAVSVDSLEIIGLGMPNDDPLYAADERLTTVYLPMRSTQSETTWLFRYRQKALDDDRYVDTLTFRYTSSPYFASSECGVIYKYLITYMECTDHVIDHVEITDSLITNLDLERIKIYFRAEEEEGEQQ